MTQDHLSKPNRPQLTWIGAAHNPEVAGSNPAPAMSVQEGEPGVPPLSISPSTHRGRWISQTAHDCALMVVMIG